MKSIRLLFISGMAITMLAWFSNINDSKKTEPHHDLQQSVSGPRTNNPIKKLEQKAADAKLFMQRKNFNGNTCFFIDMSLSSGQSRFFIYDLKNDSVMNAGLVAHGNCFEYWLADRRYSNAVGSGCTSLGKYKIGNSYTGKFGYSYKLYGLDSSNNNAFERTVVLHSHGCIPETEIADEICQSNGCPTVSPNFLEQLKKIINTSKKPVLLWIYE
jgi:hypothetical protein